MERMLTPLRKEMAPWPLPLRSLHSLVEEGGALRRAPFSLVSGGSRGHCHEFCCKRSGQGCGGGREALWHQG